MSLDVYLTIPNAPPTEPPTGPRIFVRKDGATQEISREEWDAQNPGQEPVTVETPASAEVFSANITHNLNEMAKAAGVYGPLWRPEENGIATAAQLIEPLTAGLEKLERQPMFFCQFNPPNKWGDYNGLVAFVRNYLAACQKFPEATVSVWR